MTPLPKVSTCPLEAGVPVLVTDTVALLFSTLNGFKTAHATVSRFEVRQGFERWVIEWNTGDRIGTKFAAEVSAAAVPGVLHEHEQINGYPSHGPHVATETYRIAVVRVGRAVEHRSGKY